MRHRRDAQRGRHDSAHIRRAGAAAIERIAGTMITPDTPLRLKQAAEIAFPGGSMTASGLRREAKRGRLAIETIAGKHFTTLRAIEEMRDKCRDNQKASGCGSNQRSEIVTEGASIAPHGSLEMERVKSARAALEKTAKALSGRSPSTSPANTGPTEPAAVIPLKSRF